MSSFVIASTIKTQLNKESKKQHTKNRLPSDDCSDRSLLFEKKAATYSPVLWTVPSARPGLTSLFGMVRGGTPVL